MHKLSDLVIHLGKEIELRMSDPGDEGKLTSVGMAELSKTFIVQNVLSFHLLMQFDSAWSDSHDLGYWT